jgi:hypothetical protein
MLCNSRNIDRRLIRAALESLPEIGAGASNIWQVCGRAGANLDIYHYHFKTREVFVHTILQQVYDGKSASPTLEGEVFSDAAISQRIGMALGGSAKSRPFAENSGGRK